MAKIMMIFTVSVYTVLLLDCYHSREFRQPQAKVDGSLTSRKSKINFAFFQSYRNFFLTLTICQIYVNFSR